MTKTKHAFFQRLIIGAALTLVPLLSIAHDGHHTKPAWDACLEKAKDDDCSYILQKNKLYSGTCLAMPDGLMCVRNKPITVIAS